MRRKHRLPVQSVETEALLRIDHRHLAQVGFGQDHGSASHLHMRADRAMQLQPAQSRHPQPTRQVARTQGSDLVAAYTQVRLVEIQLRIEAERAFDLQRIAVVPQQAGNLPAVRTLLSRGDSDRHRHCRQREVTVAHQHLAATQAALQGQQRQVRGLAVIDVEQRAKAFGGDAAIRRIQAQPGQRQVALHTQRLRAGGMDIQASAHGAGFQVRLGPGLRQQRLRPGQGHAGQVDAGDVGAAGIAVQRQVRRAAREHGIGGRRGQVHTESQRTAPGTADLAFAAPFLRVGPALQRTAPGEIIEAIAEIGRQHPPCAEDQLPCFRIGRPLQAHADLLQARDRGGDAGDPRAEGPGLHGSTGRKQTSRQQAGRQQGQQRQR